MSEQAQESLGGAQRQDNGDIAIRNRVQELESSVSSLKSKSTLLEGQLRSRNYRCDELDSQLNVMRGKYNAATARLEELEAYVSSLESKSTELETQLWESHKRCQELVENDELAKAVLDLEFCMSTSKQNNQS